MPMPGLRLAVRLFCAYLRPELAAMHVALASPGRDQAGHPQAGEHRIRGSLATRSRANTMYSLQTFTNIR
jgi:hypothetical protein